MSKPKVTSCEICGLNRITAYKLITRDTEETVAVHLCDRCFGNPNRVTWLRWRRPST